MSQQEDEVDGQGEEGEKAVWGFCGSFPLREIRDGRRACRKGWRNCGDDFDMLAAVRLEDRSFGSYVGLQRESATAIEGYNDGFIGIEDMLATDWYLEKGKTGTS